MYKKPILLICFVLVLGLVPASAAKADLVGWWMLDETSGTTAYDSSGNGHDGTIGGNPQWVTGHFDGALDFDGTEDYVDIVYSSELSLNEFTVSAWVNISAEPGAFGVLGTRAGGEYTFDLKVADTLIHGDIGNGNAWLNTVVDILSTDTGTNGQGGDLAVDTWYMITYVIDNTNQQVRLYLDADLKQTISISGTPLLMQAGQSMRIGHTGYPGVEWMNGLMDDVRIYDNALSQGEIQDLMTIRVAYSPDPADGASNVSIETNLTWTRGDGAKWDKVYFGTDPCDMSLPQVKIIEAGVNPAEYDPGDPDPLTEPNLIASTTYYWYITEVNSPDDYKGPLWSFTTVSGAAQCEYPVNGVVIAGDPYIPDPDYTYTEMTFIMGATGVKHTGYLSANRDDVVNRVEDANLGSPPLAGWGFGERYERLYYAGRPEYPPYESLIRGQVYYWTVDETDPFGNLYPGEIWSFAVQPYEAFVPSPPNEAIYIDPNVLLSWLAGYGAQSHDIFIGTSWEAVNNAYFIFPIPNSSPEYMGTTVPGVTSWQCDGLPTNTKIYWRIDGVQGRLPPQVGLIQKGRVWEFTTRGPTPGLAGEYYHHSGGTSPAGFENKVLVRIDPNVNFNFDTDPPPGVRPDGFSVRWSGKIAASHKGETYTFTTVTDDGARLWVDDQLVVDQWVDQGATAASGDIVLDDYGPYDIEMEYYENGGGASARLFWQSSSTAYGIIPDNFLSPNLEAFTPYGPLFPLNGSWQLNWEPILRWGPALFAATHNLYFSTDFDDVNERSVTPIIGLTDPCYHPPRLDLDQTYYWAVDGVNTLHGDSPWEGEVWSFTIPHGGTGSIIREWWTGIGGDVVSDLTNNALYPDYPDGQELIDTFDGPVDVADDYGSRIHGWLRPPTTGDYTFWIASDNHSQLWLSSDAEPGNVGTVPIAQQTSDPWDRYNWDAAPERKSDSIYLEAGKKYYIAGLMKEGIGGDHVAAAWQGPGIPVREVIDGEYLSPTPHDPPEAYGPYPRDGATGIQDRNPTLSWKPGFHVQAINGHKLYFSPHFEDVNGRNLAAYKGALTEPNYPVPAPPLLLDRTYHWAVDEVNDSMLPPTNLWKGKVWSFTMAPCMTVDNMEDYNDRTQIRGVWTDGYASVGWGGVLPYLYPLNTASSGSNLNASTGVGSPLGVSGPIQGGDQAMVLLYDNDGHTYTGLPGAEEWAYDAATFSEIEANTVENLGVGQDWSGEGAKSLTMWFQGHPVSDGSSDFGSWPDFSVTGRGRDIWNSHDEFHFLAMWPWVLPIGQTTHVQMRVVGMDNTDPWAKAGLMIREKMTPYSKYAAVFVTPGNGITFQWRDVEGGPSGSAGETTNSTWNRALETPIYLKLERTSLGAFTASYSNTGDSWDWADVNVSQNPDVTSHIVSMGDDTDPCLYGGAAVTSHDGAQLCVADFNNWDAYPWPGTQPWVDGEIGLNAPEQLYVALQDTLNNISVIEHSDVNAATLTSWQEWNIKLTDFVGVNLDGIKKVRIGLGDRDVPQLGGSGALYVDNIQACPPRCIAALVKPLYDIAEPYDCIVDEKDLVLVGAGWLLRDEVITTQAPSDTNLIARYTFDTDYTDSVGGFNLDPNGTVQIVTDPVRGGVLDLSGAGYLHSDHNAVDLGIDGNTPRTFSCWAYTRQFGEGGLYEIGQHVNSEDWSLRTYGSTEDTWRAQHYGYPTYDFDFVYPSENVWVQFTHVYDGNEIKVYANGSFVGSLDVNLNTSGSPKNLHIGMWSNSYYNGLVDDLRIYNYGLSQEEAAYLAAEGAGTLHIPILSDADVYKGEAEGSQWINLKDYSLIASKYLEEILWPTE